MGTGARSRSQARRGPWATPWSAASGSAGTSSGTRQPGANGTSTCCAIDGSAATAEQTAAATITFDNGKEFACHKQIAEAPGCDVYFARPCHSGEHGTNENMNGLIRQYFPKGTDFDQVTDEEIAAVERKLNMRPRKRLGDRAPIKVFYGGLQRRNVLRLLVEFGRQYDPALAHLTQQRRRCSARYRVPQDTINFVELTLS